MSDEVRLTIPSSTPNMRVAYISTIVPILGHLKAGTYPDQLPDALLTVQRYWRGRLNALRHAGWGPVQGKKFGYAWNCPPCCVKVEPRRIPCRLPICPFCFARRVESIYQKVRWLAGRRRAVLTYREYNGGTTDALPDIRWDANGTLNDNISELLDIERLRPRTFCAEHLDMSFGSYHWYTVSPTIADAKCPNRVLGHWSRKYSCVAVMPHKWDAAPAGGVVTALPRPYRLAALVGNVFMYRPGWLFSDPFVMAAFLDAIKGTRFIIPFGEFKRAKSH